MIHFKPTLGIKDTAKNVNNFVKDNMEVFWDVFKPLAPYVAVLTILDIVVTEFLMPIDTDTGEPYEFPLGELIAGYFFTCLAITWHRVVIHGADRYEPMNPLNPKKSELAFVGMGILLFMMFFIGGMAIGLGSAMISPALLLLLFPFIFVGVIIWTKCMFYFPAKATGKHISLGQSFQMTKGYTWKLIAASFMAYLKILLLAIVYLIGGGILLAGGFFAISSLGIESKLPSALLQIIYTLPLTLFFQPLFAVIWVTVLSNYYQYVLQNEAPPEPNPEAAE